jgi:hypothetical protein
MLCLREGRGDILALQNVVLPSSSSPGQSPVIRFTGLGGIELLLNYGTEVHVRPLPNDVQSRPVLVGRGPCFVNGRQTNDSTPELTRLQPRRSSSH